MTSTTDTSLQSRARHGLRLDTALAEQILVRFIADAISKFGFTRAVVATSGGIDSALTCALAARALGPDNVLALMLPYRTSNPASRGDAETLAQALEPARERWSLLADQIPASQQDSGQDHRD